jgi:hypothetical protein
MHDTSNVWMHDRRIGEDVRMDPNPWMIIVDQIENFDLVEHPIIPHMNAHMKNAMTILALTIAQLLFTTDPMTDQINQSTDQVPRVTTEPMTDKLRDTLPMPNLALLVLLPSTRLESVLSLHLSIVDSLYHLINQVDLILDRKEITDLLPGLEMTCVPPCQDLLDQLEIPIIDDSISILRAFQRRETQMLD